MIFSRDEFSAKQYPTQYLNKDEALFDDEKGVVGWKRSSHKKETTKETKKEEDLTATVQKADVLIINK